MIRFPILYYATSTRTHKKLRSIGIYLEEEFHEMDPERI